MKKSNSTRVKAPTNSQTPLPQSLQEAEQYDASIPNPIGRNDGPPTAGRTPSRAPIGRTAADTSDGKRAFLNAKSSIGIGTWNVRTLNRVCRKTLFSSDQFETPGELSLGIDYQHPKISVRSEYVSPRQQISMKSLY